MDDTPRPAMKLFKRLDGKVAIITGATRGIGRECAFALAKQGCSIVVAAKTVTPQPTLPGTIYTVAAELEAIGAKALAVKCDMRDENDIEACVAKTIERFGRVDILINNASALWWQDIVDTPPKKFDLIVGINARGSLLLTRACLPHMKKNGFGRVITMSPPITPKGYSGRTAYNISKMGMTMVAMGVAEECEGMNITGNSLWPATIIESYASINFELGERSMWRKASILSDCTVAICSEDGDFTGNMIIDDEYLKYRGLSDEDLVCYRYDPDVDPPRPLADEVWENKAGNSNASHEFRRGTVREMKAKL
eukprot:m.150459 g.150459  ORF g.150459 m.150459 type:complete len:310 (-) comp30725_c2_seq3:158-1087(-)